MREWQARLACSRGDHLVQRAVPERDDLLPRHVRPFASAKAEVLQLGPEELGLRLPVDEELVPADLDGARSGGCP